MRVSTRDDMPTAARLTLAFWNRLALSLRLAAGCFIYCRRKGFEAIGGFSQKMYAGEEILFSRSLAKWGKKREMSFCIIAAPPVLTSMRKLKWLTSLQLLQLVLLACFPVALRSRSMCSFWYRRP